MKHWYQDDSLRDVRGPARGSLLSRLWQSAPRAEYSSEFGQDSYLDREVFQGAATGTFVEAGAFDGVTHSNTLLFERRGWSGLLIEAAPEHAAAAAANRSAVCLNHALGARSRRASFLRVLEGYRAMSGLLDNYSPGLLGRVRDHERHREEVIEVDVHPLGDVLLNRGLTVVDYISLDLEGAETSVLTTFPFDRVTVRAWSIENNAGDTKIARRMAEAGYVLVEYLGVDEIYVRADLWVATP